MNHRAIRKRFGVVRSRAGGEWRAFDQFVAGTFLKAQQFHRAAGSSHARAAVTRFLRASRARSENECRGRRSGNPDVAIAMHACLSLFLSQSCKN